MGANTITLIQTLQRQQNLASRYTNIGVINRDPHTGDRKGFDGALSVIFRAEDSQTKRPVALKFFDPDIGGFGARYRMDLFARECELLERLVDKPRCLQLVQPLTDLPLSVPSASGHSTKIVCSYCVIEWLDGDITEYFLRQDQYDALTKLALFRQTVLGVFALHREGVAHRDIKHDNIRRATRGNREIVVPIDLGTAIDLHSTPIGGLREYSQSVGAPAFAPLEAHHGLAHLRTLSPLTDVYALGCLLHDLFNADMYVSRLTKDPGFNSCFMACHSYMSAILPTLSTSEKILREWNGIITLTKGQVNLPPINSTITTVPPEVREQLNNLLHRLTDVDYRRREIRLDKIIRFIDSSVRSLNNRLSIVRQQEKRVERKRRQEAKTRHQQERLDFYLRQKNSSEVCHDSR